MFPLWFGTMEFLWLELDLRATNEWSVSQSALWYVHVRSTDGRKERLTTTMSNWCHCFDRGCLHETLSLEEALGTSKPGDSAVEKWDNLQETIYSTVLATFRKKTTKSSDWFEAKSSIMTSIVEAKRAALAEYRHSLSERTLQKLRSDRSKVRQAARHWANEYWLELSQDIQTAAMTGNMRGIYNGIKKALGPIQSKTAPLKSSTGDIITDSSKQMERWVEHYFELYSQENIVSHSVLENIECLPIMDEQLIQNQLLRNSPRPLAVWPLAKPQVWMEYHLTWLSAARLHCYLYFMMFYANDGLKDLYRRTWKMPK